MRHVATGTVTQQHLLHQESLSMLTRKKNHNKNFFFFFLSLLALNLFHKESDVFFL